MVIRIAYTTALIIALAGCETTSPRPDFLAKVQENCRAGIADACTLAKGLQAAKDRDGGIVSRAYRPNRTQAERNADAIMQGIDRTRGTPRPAFADIPAGPG